LPSSPPPPPRRRYVLNGVEYPSLDAIPEAYRHLFERAEASAPPRPPKPPATPSAAPGPATGADDELVAFERAERVDPNDPTPHAAGDDRGAVGDDHGDGVPVELGDVRAKGPNAPDDRAEAIPCAVCGYDLRGADVARCPESGTPIAEALPGAGRPKSVLRRALRDAELADEIRVPRRRRERTSLDDIRSAFGRYSFKATIVGLTLAILILLVSSLIRMAMALR